MSVGLDTQTLLTRIGREILIGDGGETNLCAGDGMQLRQDVFYQSPFYDGREDRSRIKLQRSRVQISENENLQNKQLSQAEVSAGSNLLLGRHAVTGDAFTISSSLSVKPSTTNVHLARVKCTLQGLKTSRMSGSSGRSGQRKEGSDTDATQVLPSQVFLDYENSRKQHDLVNSDGFPKGTDVPASTSVTVDGGIGQYNTGDTGHIDLLGAEDVYNEHEPDGIEDDVEEIENIGSYDELEQDTQMRLGAITSPAQLSPTTPAIAGHKRDIRGKTIEAVMRTPAQDLTAMFSNKGILKPAMGLSQVFHQTQAATSPPSTGRSRSDPVFERPSPDLRPGHQSSPAPESSPVVKRKGLQRAITDPREVYVSMRDSQERRKQQAAEIQRGTNGLSYADELSPDIEFRKAELRRQKAALAEETKKLFSTIGAPISSDKKGRKRKLYDSAITGIKTPVERKTYSTEPVVISDDTPRALRDEVNEHSHQESDVESRDEYDELSQDVINFPRSSPSKMLQHKPGTNKLSSSPQRPTVNRRSNVHQTARTFHVGLHAQPNNLEGRSSPHTVQVAQSQPYNNQSSNRLVMPPRPVLASSLDSGMFVPQSQQDFSISSSARARPRGTPTEISSSIAAAPHIASDPLEDGHQNPSISPPSSPPLGNTTLSKEEQNLDPNHLENNDQEVFRSLMDKTSQSLESSKATRNVKRKGMKSVPDTSPVSNNNVLQDSPSPDVSLPGPNENVQLQDEGHGSLSKPKRPEVFDTAATHLTGSNTISDTNLASHRLPKSRQSHEHKLTDVELEAESDFNAANESLFRILDDEDQDFLAGMKGQPSEEPEKKRSKISASHAKDGVLKEPSIGENRLRYSRNVSGKDQCEIYPNGSSLIGKLRPNHEENTTGHQVKPAKTIIEADDPAKLASTPAEMPDEAKIVSRTSSREPSDSNIQRPSAVPSLSINTTTSVKRFPNRVLAHFKDSRLAFWPATCSDIPCADGRFKVRFDDGNIDELPITSIFTFEIVPGDPVRLDIDGLRGKVYAVCETKDKLALSNTSTFPETDVFGNRTVVVRSKQKNIPGGGTNTTADTIEVPMAKVYITSNLVRNYSDRAYRHDVLDSARLATPTNVWSVPTSPSSRGRRRNASAVLQQVPLPTALDFDLVGGLFRGMAFAISYSDNAAKAAIMQLIQDNGGRVLAEGFEPLFNLPDSLTLPLGTPPPSSATERIQLSLSTRSADLGFVCLVTDNHSRREKYMQALALDLPCLSGRWIHDSVNKEALLAWDRYLLPAGESSVLNGAVRSRTLRRISYDAQISRLKDIIDERPKTLDGKNIIIVVGTGKAEERRRAYVFLTFVLGATRVERVKDILSAKKLLSEPEAPWDWVYVDDGDLESAATQLSVSSRRDTTVKKRKRQSDSKTESGLQPLSSSVQVGERKVRIVGDEFVVQTLILGALVEED